MAENKATHSDASVGMLKANLGFFDSKIPVALETHLLSLLDKAFADFVEMKIILQPGTLSDDFDQATYAAWLYRNSAAGAGKTEMLKSIIRNRQVNSALKDGEATA
jgi:hypothetical protein